MRLHRFSDNENLTQEEYQRMLPGIESLKSSHFRTREYVSEKRLDPEVFLPRNVWEHYCDLDAFAEWSYDLANISKVLSPFSGHYMALWGRVDQGDVSNEMVSNFYRDLYSRGVPEQFDDMLDCEFGLRSRIDLRREELIRLYKTLVSQLPSHYRILTPSRCGEIGILHDDNIVNFDVLTYQSRINALCGNGVLPDLEHRVNQRGCVKILEIGPGHCYMAHAFRQVFKGRLQMFLVDLPKSLVNGYVYLSTLYGTESIQLVTEETLAIGTEPFVLIPNYLLPLVTDLLPDVDLALNAISLNEMNKSQNEYYIGLIRRVLRQGSCFYLEGGSRYIDDHFDALNFAKDQFSVCETIEGRSVNGTPVYSQPNSFFRDGDEG